TGKTESAKALGAQLGRLYLYSVAMKILISKLWVVSLSGFVKLQVQTILLGLKTVIYDPNAEVKIVGKSLKVNLKTGFQTAETLASKVVLLFNLCAERLSPQVHYDFGLRALRSVLVSTGNLKRERLQILREAIQENLNMPGFQSLSYCQS
ncbi:14529_t:CDS:2, partial [Cetraspora pellucida]